MRTFLALSLFLFPIVATSVGCGGVESEADARAEVALEDAESDIEEELAEEAEDDR